MTFLSDRIKKMAESATIQMAAMSRKLKSQGIDIIDLSLGEPDFDTPLHIQAAAKKAVDDGYFKYMPVPGYLDLREVVSHKFKRDNGLHYSPEQIVVSTGAKQTLANVILATLNPGDEAIMPAPYWVSYAAQISLAEAKLVSVKTTVDNDFKMTPEQLQNAITNKTKLLLFSSPCNPTGSVYSRQELEGLSKVLSAHPQILVVADEIYEHINFTEKHESIGQFAALKDRVVTVNGLSKGFAMTGWRLGYMGAPLEIAKACSKMQGQFTSGTCSITQRAAIEALSGDLGPTMQMKARFKERREMVLRGLKEIDGLITNEPKGAFYFFPNASSFIGKRFKDERIGSIDDLCMYLLNEAHVSVVTGSAFGDDECFRISYATSEEKLAEALKRIHHHLSVLSD